MDLVDARTRTMTLLREKQATMERLRAEVDELELEIAALDSTIARWQGGQQADTTWRKFGRSEAVVRALEEAGGELSNAEILKRLRAGGRTDDTVNYVAAALSHLKKRGVVMPLERGRWKLVSVLLPEALTRPSGSSSADTSSAGDEEER